MSAKQDYVALDWIKDAISQILDQAEQALETAAQSAGDASSMRACLTSLHQVHGTLQMVELEGPTILSREMEEVAQALMNNEVPDVGGAQEVLMQAILQLPGYLDRVQKEQRESPASIRPLINDLRVSRGAEPIEGGDEPEAPPASGLGLLSSPSAANVIAAFETANGAENVKRLRARYQQVLGAVLKKDNPRENLALLGRILGLLMKICGESPVGHLCDLAAAVVEGTGAGAIRLDSALANDLRAIDTELKRLADRGSEGLADPVSAELGEAFLGAILNATKETPAIAAARQKFGESQPAGGSAAEARGPDAEALGAVGRVLMEEFAGINDKLDLYVRSQNRYIKDLTDLIPQLEQVKSTLSVIGLASQQQSVAEQIELIRGLEDSGEAPDEETLLGLASAFLKIGASLQTIVGEDAEGEGGFADVTEAETSVIKEIRNGLAHCKDRVIDYVSGDFDSRKLQTLPEILRKLRGGLVIVNQTRAADVLTACAAFVDRKLLRGKGKPSLSDMDDLADAVTSIDYYLERFLENAKEPYLQMMEVAEAAVTKLGFPPGQLPEFEPDPEEVGELEDESEEFGEVPLPDVADVEGADEAPQEKTPRKVDAVGDLVDEEIVEIFVEEAKEVVDTINEFLAHWQSNISDSEALAEVRRGFHTLKGSGRMVGAGVIGELSWAIEDMLNGVMEGTVEPGQEMLDLIAEAVTRIPQAIEYFKAGNQGSFEVDDLIVRADAMAAMKSTGTSSAPEELLQEVEFDESLFVPPMPAEADEEPEVDAEEVELDESLFEPTVVEEEEVELPEDNIDDDVLPIFLEEADELVEAMDQSILDWSRAPDDNEPLDNLLRQLHTIKGSARIVGLASLGEYAHNFETFLIGIKQAPVDLDDAFFATVNRQQDEITRRVGIYRKLSTGEATDDELDSMRTAGGVAAAAAAGAVQEPAAPAVEEAPPETASEAEAQTESGEEAEEETAKPATSAQTQPAEMVRVSSALLEDLISLAGEASITRGRIEQQIVDFGDALVEMEETIERVREQVRRLEIETESRETVFRGYRQDGNDLDSGFDELEMDRYTMLQEISRALSEGSSDMMDLKETLVNKSRDAETLLHQQARISSELQEGLTRTRMVPFARLIPRLRRIVRQISNELGKSVRFDAYNVEGELDRNVLDRMVAPLEHMLRNAVDHGIESAEKRIAAGKPEQGRISLRLSREGGYVVLTISDDGGGIDLEAVKAKAIERGLITADTKVSDEEIRQFILQAGFSTAQKLTQISGRGVGMDVVLSEIRQLGGSVSIDSTLGVGTEFSIQIPFTVSINRALMVVVQDETYAIPLNTIEGIYRVSPYELEAYYQPDAPMFEAAGQPYRLVYMGQLLEKASNPNFAGQVAPLPVILARSGGNAVAFQVDRVIGSREVVVKSLGPQFNEVGGVSGATVMGDGSVVIILDVMALVRSTDMREVEPSPPPEAQSDSPVRTVLIVDDSVAVRKITSRLMERQGWEVLTAKDGVDAMGQLQDTYPDIMLLDIEMPRMDGFEVLSAVRRDERLKALPIIMITSRTGTKHQQQAVELGVNRFLGKPFQEANLLSTIDDVLTEVGG